MRLRSLSDSASSSERRSPTHRLPLIKKHPIGQQVDGIVQQIKSRRGRKGGNQPAPAPEAPVELEEAEESIRLGKLFREKALPLIRKHPIGQQVDGIVQQIKSRRGKKNRNQPAPAEAPAEAPVELEEVEESFFKKIVNVAKGVASKAIKAHPIGGAASSVLEGAKGGKKGKKL
eukprot:TRINITY_DN4103_c0_g1_i6.p1 TRINITY_DN4103_c0_g1~~TRINITY_DN4103_c0_g1_i6.p1  ORF type:complete len:174 (-),score=71.82 TRINITY_DN4103_c0_g1_i6:26-547(-)